MSGEIRPYQPTDRADVYDVCVRTAAAGGDARGRYSTDGLIPDVWAGPYLEFDPDLAFVVEVDGSVGGYLLATADTRAFAARYQREWIPYLAERYTWPAALTVAPAEIELLGSGFDAGRLLIPEVDEYPAHFHIDLLPELQAKGLGRRLIGLLTAELYRRGVPGLHLGMDPANTGARAFYDRLGFAPLPSSASTLGLRIRSAVPTSG